MNVVINILRVITCTFAGLLCVKRKRVVVVFIVMRLRCDYKLSLGENGYFLNNKPQKELDTSSRFKEKI